MSRIFISHSSVDNAKALALGQWLSHRGWTDYFLDVHADHGIVAGERWLQAFLGAVARCEAVLFLLSPAWCRSHYCTTEIAQAKAQGKRLFGLLIESVDWASLPVALTGDWQLCDLSGNDDPVHFRVRRPPIVRADTPVSFPRAGLEDLARGLQRAGLDVASFPWPPDNDPEREPYRGLDSLDEADAGIFFGRDADLVLAMDQIRRVLERRRERLFVILGASGAGKSSFLRAGLLPRLRNDSEHFCVLPIVRPESAVIEGKFGLLASLLAARATYGLDGSRDALRTELFAEGQGGLAVQLKQLLDRVAAAKSDAQAPLARPTIILPIDQAEELFGSDGNKEAGRFLSLLQRLGPVDASLPVLLIFTIRSDNWATWQAEPTLQSLSPELCSLAPIPSVEYKAIVEGPARRYSEKREALMIDPKLSAQLVREHLGPDALPLLALTLQVLYREFRAGHGNPTRLGLDEYERLGGMKGIINVAVARAFAQPASAPAIPADAGVRERHLRQAFVLLATVDERTGEARRRLASRAKLRECGPEVDALVQRLIGQRLLRSDDRDASDDAGGREAAVEVAHEALLRRWDLLDGWVQEHADALRTVETVKRAAKEWSAPSQMGIDKSSLLVHRGDRLERAEALFAHPELAKRLDDQARKYLQQCRQTVSNEQRERDEHQQAVQQAQVRTARIQRRLGSVLLAATALTLALGIWISWQARDVRVQTSLVLAEAAERALDEGLHDRALRLGILAVRPSWLHEAPVAARAVLVRAAEVSRSQTTLYVGGSVWSKLHSPDGKRVLTVSWDGTTQVWDVDSGQALGQPMKYEGLVDHLIFGTRMFSPDGKRVLTATVRTVQVWDVDSGRPLGQPMEHKDYVTSAHFSPDGKWVLTASGDTAQVWAAENGEKQGQPMKHEGEITSAHFSPNGKRVLTAAGDTAQVWAAESAQALGQPMKHEGEVTSALFSPDGKRVLTASDDGTARVWAAESGQVLGQLMKHEGEVTSALFSPDGKRVLTASGRMARVWNAEWEALLHSGQEAIQRICTELMKGQTAQIRPSDAKTTVLMSPERIGTSVCP